MKHNLSNAPKKDDFGVRYPQGDRKNDYIRFALQCSDWFEAFEKELRKRLSKLEKRQQLCDSEIYEFIQEILGDEKP